MDIAQPIVRLYARLLCLYPRPFRAEFGDEMRTVFGQAVDEALDRGAGVELARLCVRELASLPKSLLTQYWLCAKGQVKEATMCGMSYPSHKPGVLPLGSDSAVGPVLALMRKHPTIQRGIDILFSALWLIALAPLLLLIAVVVRLDSPGPVFFRQRRVGKGGDLYTMYKFRSMIAGASRMLRPVGGRDPRLTRVGRVIRTLYLDELPQLYNVLRGEMSIIGPRPELPQE
jgi:hypothetical protein